jgi:hypothetical protein
MSSRMRLRRCSIYASAVVWRRTLRSMAQLLAPPTMTSTPSNPTRKMRLRTLSREGGATITISSRERSRMSKGTSWSFLRGLGSVFMQMPVTRIVEPNGTRTIGTGWPAAKVGCRYIALKSFPSDARTYSSCAASRTSVITFPSIVTRSNWWPTGLLTSQKASCRQLAGNGVTGVSTRLSFTSPSLKVDRKL